jgi:NTP pyrophosphatase (non-canonical NTP hydrolase)
MKNPTYGTAVGVRPAPPPYPARDMTMNTPADPTLAEFQRLIHDRYYATDSARGIPGTFMWFIEEVGELATALHEVAAPSPDSAANAAVRQNLEEEFADVLAWLCTLANIADVDLAKAIVKYTDPDRVKGVKG